MRWSGPVHSFAKRVPSPAQSSMENITRQPGDTGASLKSGAEGQRVFMEGKSQRHMCACVCVKQGDETEDPCVPPSSPSQWWVPWKTGLAMPDPPGSADTLQTWRLAKQAALDSFPAPRLWVLGSLVAELPALGYLSRLAGAHSGLPTQNWLLVWWRQALAAWVCPTGNSLSAQP